MSRGFVLAVSLPIVGVVILAAVIVVVMRRFHRKRMTKMLGKLTPHKSYIRLLPPAECVNVD